MTHKYEKHVSHNKVLHLTGGRSGDSASQVQLIKFYELITFSHC